MPEPAEGQVPAGDFKPAPEQTQQVYQDAPEQTADSPLKEVAKEVIAGRWGRGTRRDKRLQDAGYDPVKVKEEMDKIFNR